MVRCVPFFDRFDLPCDSFLSLFPPSSPQIVLCFSPAGATLRARARKFPAIANGTAIDWFRERPREALRSVSRRCIEEAEGVEVQSFKLLSLLRKQRRSLKDQ